MSWVRIATTALAGLMSAADKVKLDAIGAGSAVASVFSRTGVVIAAANDYAASLVSNDSSVVGANVKLALNTLLAAIPSVPVASVFSRTGAVVAAANDYAASLVSNDSSVSGSKVKDALNTLLAAIPSVPVASVFSRTGAVVAAANDYAASLVQNDSGVSGATVKLALEALLTAVGTIVTAHSGMTGLSSDDHTQYALASGTRSFTGAVTATAYLASPATYSYAASVALAVNTSNDHRIGLLTGNITFTFTGAAEGRQGCIIVKQDTTGGRTATFTPPAGYTLLKDVGWGDYNPQLTLSTLTLFSYSMINAGGTDYLVIGKAFLGV
jgi:hypothetical protein